VLDNFGGTVDGDKGSNVMNRRVVSKKGRIRRGQELLERRLKRHTGGLSLSQEILIPYSDI
jgi:hypothetical protein